MATKKTSPSSAPPWERGNPKQQTGAKTTHLSPTQKASAKRAAKKAGRPYPNLVDNMHAAAKKAPATKTAARKSPAKKAAATKSAAKKAPPRKAAAKKAAAKKAPAKKAAAKKASEEPATSPTQDPAGGLTAAGRKAFAASEGAHLKPGVTKRDSEMTPEEMRRKGSWATRFYGRDPLPPLLDKQGRPTRLALTAHAWGEPVPRTEAQARRIADKGRKLLERYRKLQAAR